MFIQTGPLQYGGSCSVLCFMYKELCNKKNYFWFTIIWHMLNNVTQLNPLKNALEHRLQTLFWQENVIHSWSIRGCDLKWVQAAFPESVIPEWNSNIKINICELKSFKQRINSQFLAQKNMLMRINAHHLQMEWSFPWTGIN